MSEPPAPELSTSRLASLFDAIVEAANRAHIAVAVTMSAEDGTLHNVFVNDAAVELLGYSREEQLSIPVWTSIAPEDIPRLMERLAAQERGEPIADSAEVTVVTKSGERIPVEFSRAQVAIDGRMASVSFFVDVSARRRQERELRSSEARFRALIELAPDAVTIVRDGRVAFANPAAVKLMQAPQEKVLGKRLEEALPKGIAEVMARRVLEVLEGGTSAPTARDYQHRWRDGGTTTVEVSSLPIEYEGGPAVLSFARDITERTAMHAQLMQTDRLVAVGRLAAGVAHEINNPLGYMRLIVEYLSRELPGLLEAPDRLEEMQRRIEELGHAAERVATIVRDLRTFARADTEQQSLVDLREILDFAIKMAGSELRHRARVVTAFERVPPVRANSGRLEQVFLNLIVNAAQAVPEGAPSSTEIHVSLASRGEHVVVEIADPGSGIPPEIVGRIFDPFFTTKPAGSGTGLGLSISRSIVAQLGGSIEVTTTVGRGTTFSVSLPAEANATTPLPRSAERPGAFAPPMRLLVVDDERPLAAMLGRLLGARHRVTVAVSGREALGRLAEGATYDAVLCDLLMPDMTGMDFYERVRREHPLLASRIVFMTGAASAPRVAEFLAAVPNGRLEKPFELADVERALSRLASQLHELPRE